MTLDQVDQPADLAFIDFRLVTGKQNASRVRARQRLGELSVKLCRRLRGKLQVEPALRLDFSHCRGLRRVFPHLLGNSPCPQIIWLAALSVAQDWNK